MNVIGYCKRYNAVIKNIVNTYKAAGKIIIKNKIYI